MGHLESTPAELRGKIDSLIDTMFDPFSGIDGQYAKRDLIALGKPSHGKLCQVLEDRHIRPAVRTHVPGPQLIGLLAEADGMQDVQGQAIAFQAELAGGRWL